jgi:glycosyltransferase involved in cell wall biosynthesis
MRKSLLYLATLDPTVSTTGSTVRGRHVLRFLAERHDVHLVHMKEKHTDGRDEALLGRLASYAAVPYSGLDYFLFSRELYREARAVLERERIDFIFADFEKAGLYAALLARRFGKPFFYSSHNVEFRRYLDIGRKQPLRLAFVPYLYVAERTACRGALATFAISESDARSFRPWVPPERVSVLCPAFDEEAIHPFCESVESGPPVVLMVGNYRNTGNREGAYLVRDRILPTVLTRHPQAVFRFIGKDFPPDIRHPNIQEAGFVDDLLQEYRRATLVIAPILVGGGVKFKVIEALASGTFLVATPKAMEGIDSEGLRNLAVVPVEQFADRISQALDLRPGKTAANWERIASGYGIRHQLREMEARIESALSTRPEEEPCRRTAPSASSSPRTTG